MIDEPSASSGRSAAVSSAGATTFTSSTRRSAAPSIASARSISMTAALCTTHTRRPAARAAAASRRPASQPGLSRSVARHAAPGAAHGARESESTSQPASRNAAAVASPMPRFAPLMTSRPPPSRDGGGENGAVAIGGGLGGRARRFFRAWFNTAMASAPSAPASSDGRWRVDRAIHRSS